MIKLSEDISFSFPSCNRWQVRCGVQLWGMMWVTGWCVGVLFVVRYKVTIPETDTAL